MSPNIKRSRGALRDIQLVRWLAFATHGVTDIAELSKLGALSHEDTETLRRAHAFLLRLRHELHFRRGRAQDVLDRPTQLAIAADWGYAGRAGVLPVEEFMQDYFEHTRGVRYVSAFFDDDTRVRSRTKAIVESGLSRKIDDSIRMGPSQIWVVKEKLEDFSSDLAQVLRLIEVANRNRKRISHPTWQSIRQAMQVRFVPQPDVESVKAFLGLLRQPGRLAPLLRRLHELRIIEQLIPAMRRCRGLLQFNAYHQYTVDAHCIRAVEAATEFEGDESAMGRRYGRLNDKTLLHLALLIHDLGKGTEEDHSEVGRRIAGELADSFGLDQNSKETLQWLIAKHLLINETAFRHDLNDPNVIQAFAEEVVSIGRLELLLLHTVADLKAVGPDVLNDWKMRLIEDLYLRTRRYFETGNLPGENDPAMDARRADVVSLLQQQGRSESTIELVDELPLSLLRNRTSEEIAEELVPVGQWLATEQGSYCNGLVDEASGSVRYNVVFRQGDLRIGMFARITSALHACGLQIFRANIETVGDDLSWDSFWVCDTDFADAPPQSRINHVCKVVRKAVDEPDSKLPAARRKWTPHQIEEEKVVRLMPTNIVFDNETFDYQTIISVFTYDRPGLLASIAKQLASDGISIQFAKIDTHLDQIADVFYVTDARGEPLRNPQRLSSVRDLLMKAIGS